MAKIAGGRAMKPLNQPALRFAGFADAWEQRKLGDMAWFTKGNGYSKADLTDKGEPIILYGRLYTKYQTVINDVDTFVSNLFSSTIKSSGNEVIVPASGETAEDIARASAVIKQGVILGGDLNIVTPKPAINSVFLALILSNGRQQKELAKRAQGKSVVHLRNNDLREVNLLYPSLKEQTAIGNFFRQLDEAIAAHQRKLEKIKELKNSLLHKMFPKDGETVPELRLSGFTDAWEQGRLGAITEIFDNLRIPVTENLRAHGHTPYYGANGIQGFIDGFTHDGEFILIAEDGANNLKNYPIQYTVGKIWVNNHAHVLKGVDEVLNSLFLAYCMKSMDISKYLVGGTRAKLTSSAMKSITIIFPSLQEQTAIGNFFKQLDTVIEAYQQKSNQLHTLKTALLGKMFV